MAITDIYVLLAVFSRTIAVVSGCIYFCIMPVFHRLTTQPMKLLLTVRNVCQPSFFSKMFMRSLSDFLFANAVGPCRACKLFNMHLYATLCFNYFSDITVCFHMGVCSSC